MSAKAIENWEGVAADTLLQELQLNGECPQGGPEGGGGMGLGVHGPGQRGLSSGLELPLRCTVFWANLCSPGPRSAPL